MSNTTKEKPVKTSRTKPRTTFFLTAPQFTDAIKLIHDGIYYSSKGIGIKNELQHLSKYMFGSSLEDFARIIVNEIKNTAVPAATLEKLQKAVQSKFGDPLDKFMNMFTTYLERQVPPEEKKESKNNSEDSDGDVIMTESEKEERIIFEKPSAYTDQQRSVNELYCVYLSACTYKNINAKPFEHFKQSKIPETLQILQQAIDAIQRTSPQNNISSLNEIPPIYQGKTKTPYPELTVSNMDKIYEKYPEKENQPPDEYGTSNSKYDFVYVKLNLNTVLKELPAPIPSNQDLKIIHQIQNQNMEWMNNEAEIQEALKWEQISEQSNSTIRMLEEEEEVHFAEEQIVYPVEEEVKPLLETHWVIMGTEMNFEPEKYYRQLLLSLGQKIRIMDCEKYIELPLDIVRHIGTYITGRSKLETFDEVHVFNETFINIMIPRLVIECMVVQHIIVEKYNLFQRNETSTQVIYEVLEQIAKHITSLSEMRARRMQYGHKKSRVADFKSNVNKKYYRLMFTALEMWKCMIDKDLKKANGMKQYLEKTISKSLINEQLHVLSSQESIIYRNSKPGTWMNKIVTYDFKTAFTIFMDVFLVKLPLYDVLERQIKAMGVKYRTHLNNQRISNAIQTKPFIWRYLFSSFLEYNTGRKYFNISNMIRNHGGQWEVDQMGRFARSIESEIKWMEYQIKFPKPQASSIMKAQAEPKEDKDPEPDENPFHSLSCYDHNDISNIPVITPMITMEEIKEEKQKEKDLAIRLDSQVQKKLKSNVWRNFPERPYGIQKAWSLIEPERDIYEQYYEWCIDHRWCFKFKADFKNDAEIQKEWDEIQNVVEPIAGGNVIMDSPPWTPNPNNTKKKTNKPYRDPYKYNRVPNYKTPRRSFDDAPIISQRDYNQHENTRVQIAKNQTHPYAKFKQDEESGDYILDIEERKRRGRPMLKPTERKYQKKYERRGRPFKHTTLSIVTELNEQARRPADELNETIEVAPVSPPNRPDGYYKPTYKNRYIKRGTLVGGGGPNFRKSRRFSNNPWLIGGMRRRINRPPTDQEILDEVDRLPMPNPALYEGPNAQINFVPPIPPHLNTPFMVRIRENALQGNFYDRLLYQNLLRRLATQYTAAGPPNTIMRYNRPIPPPGPSISSYVPVIPPPPPPALRQLPRPARFGGPVMRYNRPIPPPGPPISSYVPPPIRGPMPGSIAHYNLLYPPAPPAPPAPPVPRRTIPRPARFGGPVMRYNRPIPPPGPPISSYVPPVSTRPLLNTTNRLLQALQRRNQANLVRRRHWNLADRSNRQVGRTKKYRTNEVMTAAELEEINRIKLDMQMRQHYPPSAAFRESESKQIEDRVANNLNNSNNPLARQAIGTYHTRTTVAPFRTLNFTGINFDWDDFQSVLMSPQYSYLGSFHAQTEDRLQALMYEVIRRADISRWRMFVAFEWNGEIYRKYTPFMESFDACYQAMENIFTEIDEYYDPDKEEIQIISFHVNVMSHPDFLTGGLTPTKIKERLDLLRKDWLIINPNSITNCLWTSIAIADGFERNPKLLWVWKVQNKAGYGLKVKVGTRNWRAGCEEDLQKCSNWKQKHIEVYNDFMELEAVISPTNLNEDQDPTEIDTLHLLLLRGHYHSMLPRSSEVVTDYRETLPMIKKRKMKPIKPISSDTIFPTRRIVVYDLESWRDPREILVALPHGEVRIDEEVHQQAYACGWAFEIYRDYEGEEEEVKYMERDMNYALNNGYKIIDVELAGKIKKFAFKQILGENCLSDSLFEWMNNGIFHEAVFYAHNGGKFDIRLFLGQSNLMHSDLYSIVGDKTIELNGRFINLTVENIGLEYKDKNNRKIRHYINIRDDIPLFGIGPGSSLDKLGKDLNTPHKKLAEKVGIHEQMFEHTWREIWERENMDQYFENDVMCLIEILYLFNDVCLNQTGIPITAVNTGASLAKKYYLKHFYHCYFTGTKDFEPTKTIYTLTPEMDTFIRNSYGGGRCEAFISKEVTEKLYYYDFTSLYPDVARNDLPIGLPKWLFEPEKIPTDKNTEEYIDYRYRIDAKWSSRIQHKKHFGETYFWKVKVISPKAKIGMPMDPLYRKPLFGIKENNMYLFRWFEDWTEMTLFEPEILFAIEQGLDYAFYPINAIIFNKSPCLKLCMEELFHRKAQAKERNQEALEKTWKIIINSLYGVWGLKILDREGIEISRPEKSNWAIDLVTEKLMDIEKIGYYVVTRRIKDLQVKDCNVGIASAITCYARIKLYDLLVDIQNHNGTILYCDTDSVITNICIEEHIDMKNKWIGSSDGKDLGSLKNEIVECIEKYNSSHPDDPLPMRHGFDQGIIVAPKVYIVSDKDYKLVKKAHKGYKENKEKGDLVTYARLKHLIDPTVEKSDRFMVQDTIQWLGGNGDIVRNNIGVRLVSRTKYMRQTVNKGVLTEDGDIVPHQNKPAK